MKKIILIRHGKAEPAQGNDFERNLASKGILQIHSVAGKLMSSRNIPEIIYTSLAARARQTSDLLIKEWETESHVPLVQEAPVIYQAWPDTLLKLIRGIPETYRSVALVGHNPSFEDLAGNLSRRPIPMGTGNCAILTFSNNRWSEIGNQPAVSAIIMAP